MKQKRTTKPEDLRPFNAVPSIQCLSGGWRCRTCNEEIPISGENLSRAWAWLAIHSKKH